MNISILVKSEILIRIKNCLYPYFLLITFLCSANCIQAEKVWKIFGDLKIPRQHSRAFPISDTEILVIGGWNNSGINNYAMSSCEIIDLANDTIISGPFMKTQRYLFNALMLKDSNIIVISGCNNSSNGANTRLCDIFDRKTRSWQTMGPIRTGRQQFCAEFINDHEIIIVGGRTGGSAGTNETEIYDINTGLGRASSVFPVPTCDCLSSTTSTDKNIFFGGREAGENSTRTNIVYTYDESANFWSIYSNLNADVQYPSMLKLWDNKVIITGGSLKENPVTNSDDINIESNDRFILSGNMFTKRHWHQLAQYNNDSVLIVGGFENDETNITRCEWYNLNTRSTSFGPSLNFGRSMFNLVSMRNPKRPWDRILVAIGGRDNNSKAISSVEILVDSIEYQPPPPKLTQSSFDCDNFYFTVTDVNGINKVELFGNFYNVKIAVQDTLPSKVVRVKISLIDQNQNGLFNVRCYCYATGKYIDVSDTINSNPSVLKVLAPLDSGKIIVGKTDAGTLKCVKVLIYNTGSEEFILDFVRLDRTIEFSIPQSQLPLKIPASDTAELELCYLPSSLDWEYDTLSLRDLCDTLRLPVIAIGDTVFYTGNSKCTIPIKGKTLIPGNYIKIGDPYPNPGSEIVSINVTENSEFSVKCYLYDYKGELIKNSDVIEKNRWQTGSIEQMEKEYSFNLKDISTGMYFIVVETIDGKRIFPYFVMK